MLIRKTELDHLVTETVEIILKISWFMGFREAHMLNL